MHKSLDMIYYKVRLVIIKGNICIVTKFSLFLLLLISYVFLSIANKYNNYLRYNKKTLVFIFE